ncbi:MAG: WD40 repeat domain-containing protein [Ignavibacteriae bacterium]|nr:WD40 repeat domain-containing protein [Ignavibacteriota bacterium]
MKNQCNYRIKFIYRFIFVFTLIFFKYNHSDSQITFIKPTQSDTLLTGRTIRLEWNSDSLNNMVSLYYSNDDGIDWKLIEDSLTSTFYDWDVPLFDTLNLKLRAVSDYTDAPYLLYEIPNAHKSEVRTVGFSNDGKFVLSSGADSTVKVWDITTGLTIDSITLANQYVFGAYQFHGLDSIIIPFDSNTILWDRLNHTTAKFGQGYFNNIVKSCAVNPNKPLFASASYDGNVILFSVVTGDSMMSFHSDDYSNVYTCFFSDDGNMILFSTYSGDTYAYDVNSGSLIMKFNSEDRSGSRLIWSLISSPDNLKIATGCVDGNVRLYNIYSDSVIAVLSGHTGQIRSLDFRQNGNIIISGSLDGTMRQWDIVSGNEVTVPIIHGSQVLSCAYSPTGDTIVSAGRDGSIKFWRNYLFHHYEDTLNCIIKYPLKVKIPDIYSKTGDFFRMQVLAESLEDIPSPQNKKLDYELLLKFPKKLIDFRDSALSTQILKSKDSVSINIKSKILSDTLGNFLALALFGSEYSGKLNILDFKITNSDDYYIEKDDGSITLSTSCEGNTSREIQFFNSGPSLNVYPQPAGSEMTIEMNMIEKGRYKLRIYDDNGNFIKELINSNFAPGKQKFRYNCEFLQPGFYFIIMNAPSEIKLKYVLIIR